MSLDSTSNFYLSISSIPSSGILIPSQTKPNKISLLKHEDEAVPILAAQLITILLSSPQSAQIPLPALKTYFFWLCYLAKKPNTSMQDLAVQYFAGALRTSRNRLIFWEPDLACSSEIVEILKTKKDLQLQYHTLLVVWLVTFERRIARELNRRHDIIPILVEISKTAIKEKINRLVIGIFRVLECPSFCFLGSLTYGVESSEECAGGEFTGHGCSQVASVCKGAGGTEMDGPGNRRGPLLSAR